MNSDALNILLWHGYLLSGTGSNIYVRNLARELCALGHTVHLFSQDAQAFDQEFVSGAWRFDGSNNGVIEIGVKETGYKGKCYSYQPDIGEILPVFVYDPYRGFSAKTFLDLTDSELESYVRSNISAVEWLLDRVNIDIFQANHAVMSPYLAAKTCVPRSIPYVVTIHGSDLEFAVKKSRRYFDFARIGLDLAANIIALTDYVRKSLVTQFGQALEPKIKIIPSGVDVTLFRPTNNRHKKIDEFKRTVERSVKLDRNNFALNDDYGDRNLDADLPDKIAGISDDDRIITFIGKLMVTKGIQLALASMPLVLTRTDRAKLVIVGYGDMRELLEMFLDALSTGDMDKLAKLADSIDSRIDGPPYLAVFLRALTESGRLESYLEAAAGLREKVIFTGILYHEQLKILEPATEVQLIMSIFPEAFGLVVLEAIACGVLPVIANHSGLSDVADVIEGELNVKSGTFRVDLIPDKIVFELADKIVDLLSLPPEERAKLSSEIAEIPRKMFSWQKIAARIAALYRLKKKVA